MEKYWTEDVFHTKKPIIAMCHLQALPGDPGYDRAGGMKKVIALARADLLALQEGGVDGIMFSNEFSLPYLLKVNPETTAAMGRIIGELMSEITSPLWCKCACGIPMLPSTSQRQWMPNSSEKFFLVSMPVILVCGIPIVVL